jgi:myo-inositol-1(or 4)-monophosphatase
MADADDVLLTDLLDTALEAAARAAAVLRAGFGQARTAVSTKSSPTDMVSEMDRAAEDEIVRVLAERRPDDGVLGEEGAARAGTTGIRWVIDPLDGTTNYLYGLPAFAVSIGADRAGDVLIGAVVDPCRDETWTAIRGRGSARNGEPLSLPDSPPSLETSLVATGFSYLREQRSRQAERLTQVLPAVRDIRRFGSAALDLCWVAGGRFNAFYEWGLQPWDRAAGELIAREAGAEIDHLPDGTLIVAGPGLLAPLRALLEG